ncbi:MAG: hypothetical protein IT379_36190 [Deltaproteobacteria bacterium]|nr:hypothetical protein [Deltaproteobacteria bacterium]
MTEVRRAGSIVVWLVLSIAMIGHVAAAASAQDDPDRTARARALYREGLQAAQEERYGDAYRLLAQSYRLMPRPTTLLNLAGMEVATGRLVAAAEHYREFLDSLEQGGGRLARHRASAEDALADVDRRIPLVEITVRGIRSGDRVRLDGREIELSPEPIPVDPGPHEVTVVRGRRRVAESTFDVAERERQSVLLQIRERRVDRDDDDEDDEDDDEGGARRRRRRDDESGGVTSSPWFWAGAGGAVAIAVLVTVIVVASSGGDLVQGNVPPGHVEVE